MVTKKILLLGATGFVGRNVARFLKNENVEFTASSLSMGTDLRDLSQTTSLLKKTDPDIIINCAAHVGSLNYVTEKAGTVVLDNSRMLLNMNLVSVSYLIRLPISGSLLLLLLWTSGHLRVG